MSTRTPNSYIFTALKESDEWKIIKVSSGGRGIYVASTTGSKRDALSVARQYAKDEARDGNLAVILIKNSDGSVGKFSVYDGAEGIEAEVEVSVKKTGNRPYQYRVALGLKDFNTVHSQVSVTVGYYATKEAANDAAKAVRNRRM